MKKLILFVVALFCLSVNAQDISVAESNRDGDLFNIDTQKTICSDNSIKVVIDLKKSNVDITSFGEVKNYKIDKVEFWNSKSLFLYCSYKGEKIEIFYRLDGYTVGVTYENNLMALVNRTDK